MRGRLLGRLAADPLFRSSAFAGIAVFVPQLVGLVTIPVLIDRLGDSAYGVWALVGTFIVVFMTLDGGISASAQRFYALYTATGRTDLARRLTTTLVSAVTLFAGLVWAAGPWIARTILAISHVPQRYHADSILLFRNLGVFVGLLLLANVFMGYLRAQGHFGRVALAMIASQTAFVGGIVWFGAELALADMLVVALVQLGTLTLCLALGMWRHLLAGRPRFADRDQTREFFAYANRSLVTNLSSLAILQAGPFFVAVAAPIAEVGQFSVAAMLASAIRSLPMFVVTPLLNNLTHGFAEGGRERVVRLGSRFNAVWTPVCVGLIVVAAATMWFVVRGYTGQLSVTAPAAILLTLAYGFNLSTGVSTASCRAAGLPGVEARYSLALTIGILAATIPAAHVGGAIGVAVANLVVQGLAVLYFSRILTAAMPGLSLGWSHVRWVTVVAAGLLGAAAAAPSLALDPSMTWTLVAAAAGTALGWLGYAALNRGVVRGIRGEATT